MADQCVDGCFRACEQGRSGTINTLIGHYPLPFLGFVVGVGVEFIFPTTFVLMNQSLQSRRQERWGHLTLQVCLLTEQEVTKSLQMLHLICDRLGLETPSADKESRDLARATPVGALLEEIEKVREVGEPQQTDREPAGPG